MIQPMKERDLFTVTSTIETLRKEIEELENRLKDREEALPAHTIRPHQIQIIEELEEEIEEKKKQLDELERAAGKG